MLRRKGNDTGIGIRNKDAKTWQCWAMVGGKIGNGGQDMRMDESMTQVSSKAEK